MTCRALSGVLLPTLRDNPPPEGCRVEKYEDPAGDAPFACLFLVAGELPVVAARWVGC